MASNTTINAQEKHLIKPFVSLVLLLVLMVFIMGAHFLLFPYDKHTRSMQTMTQLAHMSSLSLSVSYDETVHNSTYPEMTSLGRMDFVYER